MIYQFIFLIALLLVSSKIHAEALKVSIQAKAAIVINAETGAVLYEKNAHERRFPASVTKIASGLYALEKNGAGFKTPVTLLPVYLKKISYAQKQEDFAKYPAHILEHDGVDCGFKPGEVVSFEILLHGMMLGSGNEAANAVAHHCSGSVEQFMQELNQFLKEKGFNQTHFCNPHGLHHPQHVTTAYELAKLTQLALKHPLFKNIVKTVEVDRPATNKNPAGKIKQNNRLLKPGPFQYAKAIGVKTGYTAKAGYNLVAAAEHEGRTLIAVLMGYTTSKQRFIDATKLFEAAFKEKKTERRLLTKEHEHFQIQISGAKRPLIAHLQEDLTISYFPSEEPKVSARLKWHAHKLPIKQGEKVGELFLVDGDSKIFYRAPLFASYDVDKSLWRRMKDILSSPLLWVLLIGGSVGFLLFRKFKANRLKQP